MARDRPGSEVNLEYSQRGQVSEALQAASRVLWLGAVSFEERSLASLKRIVDNGRRVTEARYLRYRTAVVPEESGARRIAEKEEQLQEWLRDGGVTSAVGAMDINPYAYWDFAEAVADILSDDWDVALVDITCMTKLHAVALANALSIAVNDTAFILYTAPESYGYLDPSASPRTGWRDVLVLPIARVPHVGDEARSRGIIIPGHEGDRLLVGLAEIEPSRGIIVMAHNNDRPDFRVNARSANSSTISDLKAARSSAWEEVTVDLNSPGAVERVVCKEVDAAGGVAGVAPVYLYPFGPKVFSLAAAMTLLDAHAERSWIVYPVPAAYDVDYSYGVGATTAFRCGATADLEGR